MLQWTDHTLLVISYQIYNFYHESDTERHSHSSGRFEKYGNVTTAKRK